MEREPECQNRICEQNQSRIQSTRGAKKIPVIAYRAISET